jgi:hypothetical protein
MRAALREGREERGSTIFYAFYQRGCGALGDEHERERNVGRGGAASAERPWS